MAVRLKAKRVGEAADCDARDPTTGHISLKRGKETQIPLRLNDSFDGDKIEARAIETDGTRGCPGSKTIQEQHDDVRTLPCPWIHSTKS